MKLVVVGFQDPGSYFLLGHEPVSSPRGPGHSSVLCGWGKTSPLSQNFRPSLTQHDLDGGLSREGGDIHLLSKAFPEASVSTGLEHSACVCLLMFQKPVLLELVGVAWTSLPIIILLIYRFQKSSSTYQPHCRRFSCVNGLDIAPSFLFRKQTNKQTQSFLSRTYLNLGQ